MKGEIICIHVSGEITRRALSKVPELEEVKNGIGGGYIEAIPGFTSWRGARAVAFCDEEGKLKGMPRNVVADTAWALLTRGRYSDHLVGPVVVITGDAELLAAL